MKILVLEHSHRYGNDTFLFRISNKDAELPGAILENLAIEQVEDLDFEPDKGETIECHIQDVKKLEVK